MQLPPHTFPSWNYKNNVNVWCCGGPIVEKTPVTVTESLHKRRYDTPTASFASEETKFHYKRPINIGVILTLHPFFGPKAQTQPPLEEAFHVIVSKAEN